MIGILKRPGVSSRHTEPQQGGPLPAAKPSATPIVNRQVVSAPRPTSKQPASSTNHAASLVRESPTAVSQGHPVYQAFPLGENDLRLLRIQPSSSFSSPIVAHLSVAHYDPVTNHPPGIYDALSYRWQDPNLKETIFINGSGVNVMRYLENALRHLRYKDRELVIWADAICINQDDMDERNKQVALMRLIYSRAKLVRIWLGEPGPDTAAAMKLINDCFEDQPAEDRVKRILDDERGSTGLAELLGRDYWTRMWMFQEIILSKTAQVHCGQLGAPFWGITHLDFVSAKPNLWPGPAKTPPWVVSVHTALFNTTQLTTTNYSHLGDLEKILLLTRRLNATDPRDKLYALLGTCKMAPYLAIDYSKPVRDVYVEFTRRYFETTGSLSLLMLAGWENPEGQTDIGLPSWTPDFRASKAMNIYLGYGIETSHLANATKGKRFTAAARGANQAGGHADPLLVAEGFLLDTVQQTAPMAKSEGNLKQLITTFDLARAGRHLSGMPQIQAFCETAVFEIHGHREGESAEKNKDRQDRREQHMLGFMREMENVVGSAVPRGWNGSVDFPALFGAEARRPGSFARRYEDLGNSQPDILEGHRKAFMKDFVFHAGKISSMFSTRGQYFGRCNHSVQPGDVLALLFGCTFPMVLRRTQDGFRLVGAAYVSGLMHGELMDCPGSEMKVQRIPLV
ncbi:heterokaryon incompatibility protein-domain-containing protein [Colletotrichum cereale]|nr:heterokaryon incompatibility protein-domain-containing protein [Colletotrichum cereale]